MSEQPNTILLTHIAVLREFCLLLEDTGKTKLQKLTYLLQETQGVDLQYSFRLHHYGPFSDELDNDLDTTEAVGLVTITRDEEGYGFHVTPSRAVDTKWLPDIGVTKSKISQLVDEFGKEDASALEVIATVHYVSKLLRNPGAEQVVSMVASLKPRFVRSYIQGVYDSLLGKGYV